MPDPTRRRPLPTLVAVLVCGAAPAWAAESELEGAPPPAAADEIQGRVERQFEPPAAPAPALRALAPGALDGLPPFWSDASFSVRLRSRYLNRRRFDDGRAETWAGGGSLHFGSGWLAEAAAVELGYFTSQRIKGEEDRDGARYLEPGQHGFGVLGVANLKLRYEDWSLTAYRQELDLPYLNGNDSRMVPNTFEAVTVRRDGARLDWIGGYVWRIKPRDSDEFVSIPAVAGEDAHRAISLMAFKWNPSPRTYAGLFGYYAPDLGTLTYAEASQLRELAPDWVARLEGQTTWVRATSDALLNGGVRAVAWQAGLRASASWRGWLVQLAATHMGDGGTIESPLGSNPSYLDRMQHSFTRAGEEAVGLALTWNLAALGAPGWGVQGSVTQGWGGQDGAGGRSDRLESDVTLDYKPTGGRWRGLWLRVRGSVLHDDEEARTQNEVRVELQYEFELFRPGR